jgi:hypothetical protein
VAVRGEAAQASSLRRPPTQWGHIGLDPCFVDEDQVLRIKASLPRSPAAAPADDIDAALLKSEQRFF